MQALQKSTPNNAASKAMHRRAPSRVRTAKLALVQLLAVFALLLPALRPSPAAASTAGSCPESTFSDVCPSDWYYGNVMDLVSAGVVSGFADGTFRPSNDLTREQLAKFVVLAAGLTPALPQSPTYADVPSTRSSYAWVETATAAGVVGGYECGGLSEPCDAQSRPYFRPTANTNRGQIAKIVSTAFGLSRPASGSPQFTDVPDSNPYYNYVGAMAGQQLIGGYPCGGTDEPCDQRANPYFRPYATTTRAQAAKMINQTNITYRNRRRTPSPTLTATATSTNISAPTAAPSNTATPIDPTATTQASATPLPPTSVPSSAPTNTLVPPASSTPTDPPVVTSTAVPSSTATATRTTAPAPPTSIPPATSTPVATNTQVAPSNTATRVPTASFTSVPPSNTPTRTATNTATATPRPAGHLYGLVGQGGLGEPVDTTLLQQQYDAGARLRLLALGWDVLQPTGPSSWSSGTAASFQQRIDAFVGNNPDAQIVLDLGIQYPPSWVSPVDPMVDQYGTAWPGQSSNGGGVNVFWSPTVRQYIAGYIQLIFSNLNFRGRLWAVRVGTYQGELLYPHLANPGANLSFWAFDSYAQAQSPVPGWRPGQPSPNGEAQRFYNWYVDNLVNTFNFFLGEIRHYYQGYVAPVTPGQGMWDGTVSQLVSQNLYDTSMNYYGTGNYWQRIFSELPPASQGVINWCSSLGDGSGNEASGNWWDWSSGKMMAYLAHQNGRQIYGENPGHNAYDTSGGADPRTTMQWIFSTMQANNYLGLMWLSQADMSNSQYASLDQYRNSILQYP